MDKQSLSEIIDKKYSNKVGFSDLMEMISEEYKDILSKNLINEGKESRFSYSIAFPKLVPTEAWGDPDSQDREQINKIFSKVRGGKSIASKIATINKFLDPEAARRKRSPSVILNMMMIVESLQAALNDYNESSAVFVFEGFMAALTGGKQIAGRVKGTLPIEDIIAFSEFKSEDPAKQGAPVSLKLLGPKTAIKGSFTNLMDYLFVRGEERIAYMVAYKLTVGEKVEQLKIFDFDISRENFVDMMVNANNSKLFGAVKPEDFKRAIENWSGDKNDLGEIAQLARQMTGYTDKGFMNDDSYLNLDTAAAPELSPEEEEAADEKEGEKKEPAFTKLGQKSAKIRQQRAQQNESLKFHFVEKMMMANEDLLNENKGKEDKKSQWSITAGQMEGMPDLINLKNYGVLDLSQDNIDQIIEIYSEILGDSLRQLLETTKDLTENIGRYYSEPKRKRAMSANSRGQKQGQSIVGLLQQDPKYKKDD